SKTTTEAMKNYGLSSYSYRHFSGSGPLPGGPGHVLAAPSAVQSRVVSRQGRRFRTEQKSSRSCVFQHPASAPDTAGMAGGSAQLGRVAAPCGDVGLRAAGQAGTAAIWPPPVATPARRPGGGGARNPPAGPSPRVPSPTPAPPRPAPP